MDKILTCLNKSCDNYLMPFVPSEKRKKLPCPVCEEPLQKISQAKHNKLLPTPEVEPVEPVVDPFDGLDDGDTVTVEQLKKVLGR